MRFDRDFPALTIGPAVLFFAACASWFVRNTPFVHSSMDFNGGLPHEAFIAGLNTQAAAERLAASADERGLRVAEKSCEAGFCRLVFESKPIELRKTVMVPAPRPSPSSASGGSTEKRKSSLRGDKLAAALDISIALFDAVGRGQGEEKAVVIRQSFKSRLIALISASGSGARIELVGVPVQNEHASCPSRAAGRFLDCRAIAYPIGPEESPAASMRKYWDVDISGRREAAEIEKLLQGLRGGGP